MSTPDKERDALLEKIRHMLELADPERGGTQGEIENAARMAKNLMDKYNISMLDVMNQQKSDPNLFVSETATYAVAKMKAWHWSLARAIDRIVGTRHYSSGDWGHSERRKRDAKHARNMKVSRMTFFGMKNNVQIACDLFDRWCQRIDTMATQAVSEYITELEEEFEEEMVDQKVTQIRFLKGLEERHPNTWRTSWLDGCLSGIHAALYEEEKKQEDDMRRAQGKKPYSEMTREEQRQEHIREARTIEVEEPVVASTFTALALYKEKVDTAYKEHSQSIGLRHIHSSASSRTNYAGFDKGHKVGKNIKLNSKELNG